MHLETRLRYRTATTALWLAGVGLARQAYMLHSAQGLLGPVLAFTLRYFLHPRQLPAVPPHVAIPVPRPLRSLDHHTFIAME